MAWFDTFFCFEQKKTILFEAKQLCFLFLLVRFILSKIDFWSSKLPEGLRGWSAFQYVLRVWFRNPFLSSNFLKAPELNSVDTKMMFTQLFKKTHQKICQMTKFWSKNWLANPWSSSKQTSQLKKRWKILRLFMKKIGWPMLYVFLLKPFQAWSFEKLQDTFWPFFHKKLSFFFGCNSKSGFP